MNSTKPDIEQLRAYNAMNQIEQYAAQQNQPQAEYLSAIKALPAAILQNGLGQTLASYRAASTDGPKQVYEHLQSWLCSDNRFTPFARDEHLLKALVSNDQNRYIAAQAETMAYARWLKKLAVAELSLSLPTVRVESDKRGANENNG